MRRCGRRQWINTIDNGFEFAARTRCQGPIEIAHVHARCAYYLQSPDVNSLKVQLDSAAAVGAAAHEAARLSYAA